MVVGTQIVVGTVLKAPLTLQAQAKPYLAWKGLLKAKVGVIPPSIVLVSAVLARLSPSLSDFSIVFLLVSSADKLIVDYGWRWPPFFFFFPLRGYCMKL